MATEKTPTAEPHRPTRGLAHPREAYCLRWGAVALTLDEPTLSAIARRILRSVPELSEIKVHAAKGELAVTLAVRRFGVSLSARAKLSQLRMKEGFIAFVLDRVEALSFLPVPDAIISYLVEKAPRDLLTYYPDDRIMVVNVNDWLPGGLDLSLDRAVFGDGEVRLEFGPGSFDVTELLREGSGP